MGIFQRRKPEPSPDHAKLLLDNAQLLLDAAALTGRARDQIQVLTIERDEAKGMFDSLHAQLTILVRPGRKRVTRTEIRELLSQTKPWG